MASSRQPAAGFSLVEVLVSIVVLSMGVLGATSMLLASVRAGTETARFTAAVNLARDLSEKVRINRRVAVRNDAANAYLVEDWRADNAPAAPPGGASCAGPGAACDGSELAAWDMRDWQRRIAMALPEARMSVCFDEAPWNAAAGAYTWACSGTGRTLVVKLGWTPHAGSEPASSSAPPRVVMQLVAGQAHDGQAGS